MRLISYSFVCMAIGISSCNNQRSGQKSEINFEDICIPIRETELSLYPIATSFSARDTTLFYGYNYAYHKFDVFDLDRRKFLRSIKLDQQGPNGISNLETFDVVNNCLLIKENYRIVSLCRDSLFAFVLKPDISYQLLGGFNFDQHAIISSPFDGIDRDSGGNLYFPVLSADSKFPFVSINIKNKTIGLLDFTNPVEHTVRYGDKMYPAIEVVNDDQLILNYNFSSMIYVYGRNLKNQKRKNIESEFTANETAPLPEESLHDVSLRVKYHLNELNFFGIKYDPYRNVLYRVHQDRRASSEDDPELYLTIISSNFSKIREIKLPKKSKPYFELSRKGIYFPVEPKNESEICFTLLLH